MARYIRNPDKLVIEIYFNEKPDDAALVALKIGKWRWHPRKGCWYNQDTPENETFAEQICVADTTRPPEPKTPQKKTPTKPSPKKQTSKPPSKQNKTQKPKTTEEYESPLVVPPAASPVAPPVLPPVLPPEPPPPPPVKIPEPPKPKNKIIFAENVKTLAEVRLLLVRHNLEKAIFGQDILDLVTTLDAYKHHSEIAAEVIKKLFPPPQMAYDKFMGELMDSDAAFLRLMCKGADIIGIAVKHTAKRDEILAKIKDDARSLAELCDDLATVLINKYGDDSVSDESAKEVETLLSDLQMLIESVKNYS